jgi:hypothetical protein
MAARKGKRVMVKPPAKVVAKKAGKAKARVNTPGAAKKSPSKAVKPSASKASNKGVAKPAAAGRKKSPGRSPVVTRASSKPGAKPSAPAPARRSATGATPARAARQLLEQRKAIESALAPPADGKTVVDAYMRDVDHPFKAEMEAVRQIILGASPKLSERIKWNAPSFYYGEDLGAFNPRATEFAHLILLFPAGGGLPEKSAILEGNHKDRREVKFHGMDDVKSKQRALEKIVRDWVAFRDS